MWLTGNEKLDEDLKCIVQSLPGLKLTVGPVLTAIGDQSYRSDGVVVWTQYGDSNENTRMFHGEKLMTELSAFVRELRKSEGV